MTPHFLRKELNFPPEDFLWANSKKKFLAWSPYYWPLRGCRSLGPPSGLAALGRTSWPATTQRPISNLSHAHAGDILYWGSSGHVFRYDASTTDRWTSSRLQLKSRNSFRPCEVDRSLTRATCSSLLVFLWKCTIRHLRVLLYDQLSPSPMSLCPELLRQRLFWLRLVVVRPLFHMRFSWFSFPWKSPNLAPNLVSSRSERFSTTAPSRSRDRQSTLATAVTLRQSNEIEWRQPPKIYGGWQDCFWCWSCLFWPILGQLPSWSGKMSKACAERNGNVQKLKRRSYSCHLMAFGGTISNKTIRPIFTGSLNQEPESCKWRTRSSPRPFPTTTL